MSKSYSGLFQGTLGTTRKESLIPLSTFSERGISIPEEIRSALSQLNNKGDYITGSASDFSMKNVSIMSKETGVEFARITIGGETILIRGDSRGAVIPKHLISRMQRSGGTLDFHSHPHNDDLIPSPADLRVMRALRESTGQRTSSIVTPNGRTVLFDEHGVLETGTVSNRIDENYKKALAELFGGKK